MRPFFLLFAVALTVTSLKAGWLQTAGAWWQHVALGNASAADAATLDAQVWTCLLAARQRRNTGPLMPDLQIHQWLLERLDSGDTGVEQILSDAQNICPEYLQVAALNVRCSSAEGLLEKISAWPEMGAHELTHAAVVVRPAPFGFGWQVFAFTGQRLPRFEPEALNGSQTCYFSTCSLCKRGQPCEIPRHTRSLSLECPHCDRIYAVLAADTHGRFRYVNEFLTGYSPPARFPRHQSRLSQLMTIWRAVSANCRYSVDTGEEDNDAWQTALETLTLGHGDCEDSSILLADWLIALGFEARVALGRYAERGGHAWVVARVDGQDYLLESTEGVSSETRPPLLSEVGSRYVPEMLFDRDAFYTRRQAQAAWQGDFWSEATWQRVVPRPRRPQAADAASPARQDILPQAAFGTH